MPKLTSSKAAEVKKAGEEGSTFFNLPEGRYIVKLKDVEATNTKKTPPDPMWVWSFEVVEFLDLPEFLTEKGLQITDPDGVVQVRNDDGEMVEKSNYFDVSKIMAFDNLRYWTVIKNTTLWDLDRVFAAFDADPDTDTDDLHGDEVGLMVVQEYITGGKLKGKLGNSVAEFFRAQDVRAAVEAERGGDVPDEDDEPDF